MYLDKDTKSSLNPMTMIHISQVLDDDLTEEKCKCLDGLHHSQFISYGGRETEIKNVFNTAISKLSKKLPDMKDKFEKELKYLKDLVFEEPKGEFEDNTKDFFTSVNKVIALSKNMQSLKEATEPLAIRRRLI